MPPAVFLPCSLHYLPFIQLMNTSGSACPVFWLLWGSSKTKPNEETLNEHLILGCKHNMIRPPGFQLLFLEKSKPLPCCLQAAEGKSPLFTHWHCSCVLLPAACWARLSHRGCPRQAPREIRVSKGQFSHGPAWVYARENKHCCSGWAFTWM